MKCTYRPALECKGDFGATDLYCISCLLGQQIDSIELLTSAVMSMSMTRVEDISTMLEEERSADKAIEKEAKINGLL